MPASPKVEITRKVFNKKYKLELSVVKSNIMRIWLTTRIKNEPKRIIIQTDMNDCCEKTGAFLYLTKYLISLIRAAQVYTKIKMGRLRNNTGYETHDESMVGL